MATGVKGEQISLGLEISAGLSSNPNIEDISVPTCDPSDEDEIKVEISSVSTEIHISESMDHFQKAIIENVDTYLNLSEEQQVTEFENIWKQTFGIEDQEEERECQANFSDLYSLFGIECTTMETKQTIYSMFSNLKFNMNSIIEYIKDELLYRFHNPFKLDQSERLVYPTYEYHSPIKEMMPYNGRPKYDYLCQDSLYKIERTFTGSLYHFKTLNPFKWIPNDCHGLIRYCSGLENQPDIIWKSNYKTQVTTLTSVLRNPDDMKTSTWNKFINDISSDVITILETNPGVTHAVVKQIIHALCFRIRLLNYEIGCIIAGLSNTAEKTLSSLVFAHAFKYLWEKKLTKRRENQSKKDSKKRDLLQYFLKKIENRKMARGTWNRDKMAKSDKIMSKKYASDYIESVKRKLKSSELQKIKGYLGVRRELFSHDSIVSIADEKIENYLKENPAVEITDVNNFVVQFICNKNKIYKELFLEIWRDEEEKLYDIISKNVKRAFEVKISSLIDVLSELLKKLMEMSTDNKILGDDSKTEGEQKFDSDNNFELIKMAILDDHSIGKEIPFKAMVNYLKMYLDPTVTPDEFKKYLSGVLTLAGLGVQVCKINILCCKSTELILDADTFRRLVSTKMFNDGELIFNIHNYVRHFLSDLKEYYIQLEKDEFYEMIASLKSDFETNMIGCPAQCPSCGKFCEREIHTNEGKCQIKTGHQISSMGGKAWNADEDHTAVLFMCDVYQDQTQIYLPSGTIKWGEFKDRCKEWNWYLPDDEKYRSKQLSNQKLMKDIWNKFAKGILNYYYEREKETRITFVPYTTYEEVNHSLFSAKIFICDSENHDRPQQFFQKSEEHKMIKRIKSLNRGSTAKSDVNISTCALHYIKLVKNALKSFVQSNVKTFCEKREDSLSHASLLSLANDLLLKELAKMSVREVTDVNNFVVQFICTRNTVLQRIFGEKWDELELLLYSDISEKIKNNFNNEMANIKSVINLLISDLEKNAKGGFQCFNSDRNFELAELNSHDLNDPTIKKIPFEAMRHYLKMYLDPNVPLGKFVKHIFGGFEIDGIKVTVSDSFVLCSKPIEPTLELKTFKKLEKTGMFNSTELILNIYDYIKQFQTVLEDFHIEIRQNEFKEMVAPFKTEFQKKIFGCPSQCPSCGKFCEREVHTNEGKCQIKTGHQISSMGGKVWNADKDNTAVLFMCDEYRNYTRVTLTCGEMEWGEFKDKCGSEWNWTLPSDKMNTSKQLSNQNIMKDVWNKFGRGILNYYETQGTRISYVPYTDSEDMEMWRLVQAKQSGGRGSVSSQIFIDHKT